MTETSALCCPQCLMKARGLCSRHYQLWAKGNAPYLQRFVDQWAEVKAERSRANSERNIRRTAAKRRGPPLRDRTLRHRYGITLAEWHAMFKAQGGRCAICDEEKPRLVVDHCHVTKRVRGLLCDGCNTFMGIVDTKMHLLEKAIHHQCKGNIHG